MIFVVIQQTWMTEKFNRASLPVFNHWIRNFLYNCVLYPSQNAVAGLVETVGIEDFVVKANDLCTLVLNVI